MRLLRKNNHFCRYNHLQTVRKLTGKIINLLALLLEDSRQGELPRAEFTPLNQQLHNIGLKPFITNTTFVFRTCIRKRLRENGMYSECSLQHIQNYMHAIYSGLCTVPFCIFKHLPQLFATFQSSRFSSLPLLYSQL